MKAHAIIGANYGDEGKGLMTDHICSREGADMVVRFNGGAQAGHTVTLADGRRHVFHHIGSGTFLGIPTFLSRYFVVNPILFNGEGLSGAVYVDPLALVTTPMDMLINQAAERKRQHGSCGVGINETMRRSREERYCLRVADMLDQGRFARIAEEYAKARIRELGLDLVIEAYWAEVFRDHADKFMSSVNVTSKPPGSRFVFEGAQGLMLDQHSPDFPHVTHSNTGIKNVLALCRDMGISDVRATYVSRSYLTRHGAGPLPHEESMPAFVKDETNVPHPFQGVLRYAPLDVLALERRIIRDAGTVPFDVAVTCLDQTGDAILGQFTLPVAHRSYGPTRADVREPVTA